MGDDNKSSSSSGDSSETFVEDLERSCEVFDRTEDSQSPSTNDPPNSPIPSDSDKPRRTEIYHSRKCKNDVVSPSSPPLSVTQCKTAEVVPVKRIQQQPPAPKSTNFIVQYFKKKSQSWSKSQFITMTILCCVEFLASTVVSIQAPFYPDVARQKGASATEYGMVFGVFQLVVFIMGPIYGAQMSYLGPTRVFNWGILVTGVCCIIFGLLDAIQDRTAFIWSCLLVRVVEAMGDAAFEIASFTIIAHEFPKSVASNFAKLEIFYGLGLIIGPTLGGALYEIGGYRLPFLTMGGLLFASAIATYLYLPESSTRQQQQISKCANKNESTNEAGRPIVHGGFQMFKMLRLPVIAMVSYSIVAATIGVGFISANLDLHLEQFHLNKFAVGSVFILDGGVYAITAPIWGWICDSTSYQKLITFAGAVFTVLGFIFVGPVPYFPSDTTLFMICFGLALFGFGSAATLVSAFLQLLQDAIKNGYPDDISTYGLVSGLWTSMAALGYFIGPSIGGVLDDSVGFRWASLFIIFSQFVLMIILGGFYTSKLIRERKSAKFTDPTVKELGTEEDKRNHNIINDKSFYPVLISVNESGGITFADAAGKI